MPLENRPKRDIHPLCTKAFNYYYLALCTHCRPNMIVISTSWLAPKETVSFVSPRPSMFPAGPAIKCFVIPPNSKLEKKCKEIICSTLAGSQICHGFKEHDLITCECKVHVVVSLGSEFCSPWGVSEFCLPLGVSEFCLPWGIGEFCLPQEFSGFCSPTELVSFEPPHWTRSPLIRKRIWVGRYFTNLILSLFPHSHLTSLQLSFLL